MNGAPVVHAQSLTVRRGGHRLLDRCSLTLDSGSICALLGPNGAGKSSFLRTLLGLLCPDEGHLEVLGLVPARVPQDVRAAVSLVPTGGLLLDGLTAAQHFQVGSRFEPRWASSTAQRVAELFDLPLNRVSRHLSTGQRVGLALAYAFASQPRLLLLDEPTNGLDHHHREVLLSLVAAYAADGGTVLFTSHVLSEVEALADTVAFMHAGHLALSGTMHDLLRRYATVQAIYDAQVPLVTAQWIRLQFPQAEVEIIGRVLRVSHYERTDEILDALAAEQPVDLQVQAGTLTRLYGAVVEEGVRAVV
ncbi:ABC transporter ATP-binding protein [Deinococcus arcticus]|uniref:ABC transporter ATP-binding protein n=1 Tax=Deinococcus arcticus TaxID=2136176 RepID=A0A2T3W9S1_9DEIO|nr:ABC transporter ATP-binding protein [Deinococcus arcticus]PTA68660.1 ABC transporter ATP-binding protein [Deinococcus arcticus]